MEQNEKDLRNMSLGDVLDYSIEVYKKNFKKLTLVALILYVPFTFLYTFIISYFSGEMFNSAGLNGSMSQYGNVPYTFFSYYFLILAMGGLYLLYSLIILPVMDAAISKIVFSDVVYQKDIGLKDTIKQGFKKFSSLFIYKLLYYLMLLGIIIGGYILIIILLVVGTLGAFPTMMGHFGVIASFVVVGLILLFIVALVSMVAYIGVKYMFGTQSIILEGKSATESFSRSRVLVKGNIWHAALAYALGSILFFAVPSILSSGAQALLFVNARLFTVVSTITQIIAALVYPYMMVLITMIFINLKIRKEGLDLEVKVDILLERQRLEEQQRFDTLIDGREATNA